MASLQQPEQKMVYLEAPGNVMLQIAYNPNETVQQFKMRIEAEKRIPASGITLKYNAIAGSMAGV